MRNRWIALVLMASLFVLAAAASATQAAPLGDKSAQLVPIGAPTWKLDDCHLFSAPIGTAETGYAEAFETFASLLSPPEHVAITASGSAPALRISRPTTQSLPKVSRTKATARGAASSHLSSRSETACFSPV